MSIASYFLKDTKELLYDWMGGNDELFFLINGIRGKWYDLVMQKISWVGQHELFPYYVAAILVWVFIRTLFKLATKQAVKYYLLLWLNVVVMLGAGFASIAVVTNETKAHFSYPRPYVALASSGAIYKLETTEPNESFRSFPSGHVTFTTFMVMALWSVLTIFAKRAGVALIILMAWSRVSLGMHFPADVVAAILITFPLMLLISACVHTVMYKIFGIR